MGIDDLAADEVIKEVLLGSPYTGGKASLPSRQLHESVSI